MGTLGTKLYFLNKRRALFKRLQRKVQTDCIAAALHGEASKEIYDQYGERELREYENGSCKALVNGVVKRLPHKVVRDAYIAPVASAIAQVAAQAARPVKVLEVGCGNATNLMLLKAKFGSTVELAGIDISGNRIDTGRRYWGDRLQDIDLRQTSATDLSMFPDNHFDVVYSICALEQITYRIHEVVTEMKRVSRGMLVCVEPVYEYGNDVQRLYNIVNDQCRTLLHDMRSCELEVEEHGLLSILHNPLNPVGLIVGRKVA